MLRVDDETPILLAIAENRLAAVTELLENDAILPLDEQFVGLQVRKLIAASTNTIELLAFLEVLQRCGLSHGAMIKLLPRKFNQFTNTKIKEDILAYISSHEAPEDKIRLCEEALNPYHPIGYIIDMMRPHHEWGKSRGVKDDIIKVMVAAQKQLRKKAPDSMEMRNQKSSDFTNQFGFVDLAIEKDQAILFRLNDPHARRDIPEKTIFDAIELADTAMIDAMIAKDPKVLIRWANRQGQRPLQAAVDRGNDGVVRHLLKCGASVDDANKYGETALHTAINSGKVDIVQLLLDNNANPHIATGDGMTAFDLAAKQCCPAMVVIFIKRCRREEDLRRAMLGKICNTLKHAKSGEAIISMIETLERYYVHTIMIDAIRVAFEGQCKTKTKKMILSALHDSPIADGVYDTRLQKAKNAHHPLGCILLLLHETMLHSMIHYESSSMRMLMQMSLAAPAANQAAAQQDVANDNNAMPQPAAVQKLKLALHADDELNFSDNDSSELNDGFELIEKTQEQPSQAPRPL